MHPGGLIGTLFSKYTYSIGSAARCSEERCSGACLGEDLICLGEDPADRWIDVVLFDVWRVDRPADEAPQADVPGRRSLNLELIRGRNTTVASRNALWTRCADGALSLAARMEQATL